MEVPKAPRPRKAKTTETTGTTDIGGSRGIGSSATDTVEDRPPRGRPKSPPKGSRTEGTSAAAPDTVRKPSSASLEARLNEFLAAAALPFALTGDDYCATIIAQRTPRLSASLVALAKENPAVRRVLNRILEGSAWGGVAIAVVSIVIPVAQHHGMVPGDDPFITLYPGSPRREAVASPPAGWNGWSNSSGNSGNDRSAMGAPVGSDEPVMTQFGNAPPGVVTVDATTAKHAGNSAAG